MYINTFKLELGTSGVHQMVAITTEKTGLDVNGNPIYHVSILATDRDGNGYQWTPEFMGIKRKDGKLRIQSHGGHTNVAKQVFDKMQTEFNKEDN